MLSIWFFVVARISDRYIKINVQYFRFGLPGDLNLIQECLFDDITGLGFALSVFIEILDTQ